MRINCKVIEDLLPLYSDNICSDESRKLLEEHLQECDKCRSLIKNMDLIQITHIKKDETEKAAIIKKGFKKIHKRWIASLIAVFMLIPVIFCGILAYNSYRDTGITFSNFDDIYRCYKYLHYIKDGKYEEAAKMVDFSHNEYLLVDSVAHMTLEEYQQYMKEKFIMKLKEYKELGISISNIRFDDAYRIDNGTWQVAMSFDEIYPDGSKQKIIANMNAETMYAGAYSHPDNSKIERDDYLDAILCLYSEDGTVWYKDFTVTFELEEGEKAIIRRNKANSNFKGVFNITYGTGIAMIDEPYFKHIFESSVPGKYSVITYEPDGTTRFLTYEEIDIEIIQYNN
ncbi:MAG: zf-HC2 domain-containing protein [Clostridia bacterium]|nr:zf-HC2 domain-containing protein [Clostridia bacterium]